MPFLLFFVPSRSGGATGAENPHLFKKVVDKGVNVWYSILTRANKAQEKGRIKMKKIIAILRAMLADETPYIPDVYNVQAFGTNGLF